MAGLRAFCEDIHSAVTEANHDWSDVTVTTALDRADDAYLTKIHGADHHLVDRTKLVTCIQNWRHRLRDEYTRLYGKDDEGLVEYLATTNLLPAEQAAFVAAARRTSEENIMNEMQKEHSKFVCFLFFSVMNDWIVLVIVPTILLLTLRF